MWRYRGGDYVEQSSEDVWAAVAGSVRAALAAVDGDDASRRVAGLGFAATCSLVCLDASGKPVSVSEESDPENERNIIVWMDHRASDEAERINATNHNALRTVGGAVSPEMEMPKLAWLRARKPAAAAGKAFDLADYLTWRATSENTRSLCTTVCKWNLSADASGARWDDDFLRTVGLGDLRDRCDVGEIFGAPGAPLGTGLTAAAAADLGLAPGAAVGVGLIDAHAGGVGSVGAAGPTPLEGRLALVAGTSCCHMASSRAPVFCPGVWGPYRGAMVPGTYLNEGGQSAAGLLLDHVVTTHPAHALADALPGASTYDKLNRRLAVLAGDAPVAALARHVHVDPDFRGNRSPLADPCRAGAIVGLTTDDGVDALAVLYLATLQALCYQTRHIVDALEAAGHPPIQEVVITGGLGKNPLFVRTVADALGVRVALPAEDEAVLLGSAVLGACSAGEYPNLEAAMAAMTRYGSSIAPDPALKAFHDAKYSCFRKLSALQTELWETMGRV